MKERYKPRDHGGGFLGRRSHAQGGRYAGPGDRGIEMPHHGVSGETYEAATSEVIREAAQRVIENDQALVGV